MNKALILGGLAVVGLAGAAAIWLSNEDGQQQIKPLAEAKGDQGKSMSKPAAQHEQAAFPPKSEMASEEAKVEQVEQAAVVEQAPVEEAVPPSEPALDEKVSLWHALDEETLTDENLKKVNAKPIQVNPGALAVLRVGQRLSFPIPHLGSEYDGVVGKAKSMLQGEIELMSGKLDNDEEFSTFTVSRGDNTTDITLTTGKGVYQVLIDNTTGKGTVISDQDLNVYRKGTDVLIPPQEETQ